jgi:hypothetical protein
MPAAHAARRRQEARSQEAPIRRAKAESAAAERVLRDAAFVLAMTREVRRAILQGEATGRP